MSLAQYPPLLPSVPPAEMHRHHSYPYAFAPQATTTRYSSSHSTSSAQSPSANPDEDWTKISDLAERRRIQNRIAQRNYRKKLKRRLEDLERRAGSSSASPEAPRAEILPSQNRTEDASKKRKPSKPGVNPPRPSRSPNPPHSATFASRDDPSSMFSRQYTRQLSASPPPAFKYSSFPIEPPSLPAPYPQHAGPYHTLPAPYPDYPGQSIYLPPLPMTRPNLTSYDTSPSKPEGHFGEDESFNHFNMSYQSMGAIEVPTTQSYSDSNAYTPPLSLSNSFDQSRATSPSEQSMMCPQTPSSIPVTPPSLIGC